VWKEEVEVRVCVEVEGVCVERGSEVLGGERCGSERGWVVHYARGCLGAELC
jgi:hypothetical protein